MMDRVTGWFTDGQIIGILRQAEAGMAVKGVPLWSAFVDASLRVAVDAPARPYRLGRAGCQF